jgi:RNA polymerase sigma-70 factor (ECF subfamily)
MKPGAPNSDYSAKSGSKRKIDYMHIDPIVSGCVAGDRRCQRMLFKNYRDRVQSLVVKSLGPDFDTDDVIQQVFIRVFDSLRSFEQRSSLDTWVYRITSKVCMDQLRRKYRKRQLPTVHITDALEGQIRSGRHLEPGGRLELKELNRTLYDGLQKLSPSKRMVLVLFEMEERSLDEIAGIIGKPVGTVKSRLFHARKEMETHLRRYLEDT